MDSEILLNILSNGNNIEKFRYEVRDVYPDKINTLYSQNENFLHKLIQTPDINDTLKIKAIYTLCDLGININEQSTSLQTPLHLAIQHNCSLSVINCLLLNGADLTITDSNGLCAYNHVKRMTNTVKSDEIQSIMKHYYPTYMIAIDQVNISFVRRLLNSWCNYTNLVYNGKSIIDMAIEVNFQQAIELLEKLKKQLQLCFAIFACNVKKAEQILLEYERNYCPYSILQDYVLNLNFKNMNDFNSSLKYYVLIENNYDLCCVLLKTSDLFCKNYTICDYVYDKAHREMPILFAILKLNVDIEIVKLLLEIGVKQQRSVDLSNLRYKGMTILRFAIEYDIDLSYMRLLLNGKYYKYEIITTRDSQFLTPIEYAKMSKKYEYANFIENELLPNYLLNYNHLRMQLAYNGYDIASVKIKNKFISDYAYEYKLTDLHDFLSELADYQANIKDFHEAIEMNQIGLAKEKMFYTAKSPRKLFINNLIDSQINTSSHSAMHRCVLNRYPEQLELLLDNRDSKYMKFSFIRDHCYRTPLHYAYGMQNAKSVVSLLLDFGFSENEFDKDGMSPLDFQERADCQELQELIEIHIKQKFSIQEPNPWSTDVWNRLQQAKDANNKIVALSYFNEKYLDALNPLKSHSHGHGHYHHHHHHHHHHGHSHVHSCDNCATVYSNRLPDKAVTCNIV